MNYPIDFKKDTWLHNSGCDFCGTPMPAGEFVSFSFGGMQDHTRADTLDLSAVLTNNRTASRSPGQRRRRPAFNARPGIRQRGLPCV